MPPYWDNITPTWYFILNVLIISFIFIENKSLSDTIWDLKKGKTKFGKGGFERIKKHAPHHLRHWNWCWIGIFI